jgi:stress response protein YsnF
MRVSTPDGPLGVLEEVINDPNTGRPQFLAVREDGPNGDRVRIDATTVDTAASTADEIRLTIGRSQQVNFGTGHYDAADTLVIPEREEYLVPSTHEEELGRVRVERHIETIPYETSVDVSRDRVDVERVAVNRLVSAMPGPRQEGDTLIVPVIEEVLVTEKRLMVREEIRIRRYRETEAVAVRDDLRREVVDIKETHRPLNEPVSSTTTYDDATPAPTAAPTGTGRLPTS